MSSSKIFRWVEMNEEQLKSRGGNHATCLYHERQKEMSHVSHILVYQFSVNKRSKNT